MSDTSGVAEAGYYPPETSYGMGVTVQTDDLGWDGDPGTPSATETAPASAIGLAFGAVFFGRMPYVCGGGSIAGEYWHPLSPTENNNLQPPDNFDVQDSELSFMFLVGYNKVPSTMIGGCYIVQVCLDNEFTMPMFAGAWPATQMSVSGTKVPGASLTQTFMMPAAIGQPVYMRVQAVDCYGATSDWVKLTETGDGVGNPISVTAQKLDGNTHVEFDGTSYGGTATTLAEALAEIAAAAGITPP